MNHDTQPDHIIRQEIDTELSYLDNRPSLHYDIMSQLKGEEVVKKRVSPRLVFALILVMITGTVAFAAAYHGVSYFLSEKSLDPDYLLNAPKHYHNSKHLEATVVDAYWDGLELFVAYRIVPIDPTYVIQMACNNPEHEHYQPIDAADVLLYEPEFINITDENGDVTRPQIYSSDWVYEDDGSLTAMISFQLYSMSQPISVGIPIYNTLISTDELFYSFLHCNPATLADPLADHEHDWSPATCLSRKVCSICQRIEGDLGCHDYHLSEDGKKVVCSICRKALNKPTYIPAVNNLYPGDNDIFVLALQLRLGELGYYSGSFTGVYDDGTTEAVKAYQESHGIAADGVCRSDTVKRLFP